METNLSITLKAKYHAFIISFIDNKSLIRVINYINQVRKAIVEDYDPEQDITVTVDGSFIVDLFYIIGSMPERLATKNNAAIKTALVPQLSIYPLTLTALMAKEAENTAETDDNVLQGVNYIMSIIV